jgi:hypothetical protein
VGGRRERLGQRRVRLEEEGVVVEPEVRQVEQSRPLRDDVDLGPARVEAVEDVESHGVPTPRGFHQKAESHSSSVSKVHRTRTAPRRRYQLYFMVIVARWPTKRFSGSFEERRSNS